MYKNSSTDPRSLRSKKSFQDAFEDLLSSHPYGKITISMIAKKAGYARHTFYNHFETKEDLLNSLVDEIIGSFFDTVGNWELISSDPEGDLKVGHKFFSVWKDHREIVKRLNSLDINFLLIRRMREFFERYYQEHANWEISGTCPEMAKYLTSLNTYTFVGILMQWLGDDMRYPPELMGQFLTHFIGVKQKKSAIEKYNTAFCTRN
jgi:AcrR family transcriptional regulator